MQSKAINAQISRVCPVAHPAPPQNPHHRSHLKATKNSKSLSVFPFRPSSRIWRHGKHHKTSRDITSHHEPSRAKELVVIKEKRVRSQCGWMRSSTKTLYAPVLSCTPALSAFSAFSFYSRDCLIFRTKNMAQLG